jgi:hypothetical protein
VLLTLELAVLLEFRISINSDNIIVIDDKFFVSGELPPSKNIRRP